MKEKRLWGFKVDIGMMYKLPITFLSAKEPTKKQVEKYVRKLLKEDNLTNKR